MKFEWVLGVNPGLGNGHNCSVIFCSTVYPSVCIQHGLHSDPYALLNIVVVYDHNFPANS